MAKIWHYTFYQELGVDPEEYPVLLTEAPLNPKDKTDKMYQIMFEEMNVPAVRVEVDSILSLRAFNKNTGVVLDCGDGVSSIVPIFNNKVLTDTISRLSIGGRDLTDYLSHLISQRGYLFTMATEREIVRDIKENLCCVALDFEQEMASYPEPSFWQRLLFSKAKAMKKSYQLPDGQVITIGNEAFICPEALFQPNFLHRTSSGIHNLLYNSIMECPVEKQNALLDNIILSGGTTMCTGFAERIHKEITALEESNRKIQIIADPKRKSLAWWGGAILATEQRKGDEFCTKKDYNELGRPPIHHG
ncbi:actin-like [Artemia franciscana]|uniref:actin-like n=1 Tax=Artemia franciscana TaxID=6661 RepID=UPI0032DACA1C